MPSLSNYPPGVSGNEPQIAGEEEELIFLVCRGCGEAFSLEAEMTTMSTVFNHALDEARATEEEFEGFDLKPESEAF